MPSNSPWRFQCDYPKAKDLTAYMEQYIAGYINEFEMKLYILRGICIGTEPRNLPLIWA